MRFVIELGEEATRLLGDLLVAIGYSVAGDGCECVYVTLSPWLTIVFELFA